MISSSSHSIYLPLHRILYLIWGFVIVALGVVFCLFVLLLFLFILMDGQVWQLGLYFCLWIKARSLACLSFDLSVGLPRSTQKCPCTLYFRGLKKKKKKEEIFKAFNLQIGNVFRIILLLPPFSFTLVPCGGLAIF